MKKVSVIIPCYNVISTIDGCMQCLIDQTIGIDNLEIILVDDASTDTTLEKLCQWEERYPESIMVIHCEENGKPGQARNIGLQYASADYIGYMDDDDWIHPTMYESLYNIAIEQECELVICQSVRQNFIQQDVQQPPVALEIIEIHNEEERLNFIKRDVNNAVWNKLYSRNMLIENDIFFPIGTYYEDMLFTNLLKNYCSKICVTNQVYYHHVVQISSISNSDNPEKRFQYIEVIMMLIEELRARGLYQDYAEWYDSYFVMQYVSFMANFTNLFGDMNSEIFAVLKQSIFEMFPNFLKIPIVRLFLEDERTPEFQHAIEKILDGETLPQVSKILIIKGTSCYDVLRYFEDTLVEAFCKMNIIVDVFDGADRQTLQKQSEHCRTQKYDFVLSFNAVLIDSLDAFLYDKSTMFWSFLVDHPYYHHYRLTQPYGNHFISCVDRNHVDYVQKYYPTINQPCYLPHGGNLPIATPKAYKERNHSVAFMGSYGNPDEVAKAIDQFPELVRMIAIHVINKYYETFSESLESLFQAEFAKYQITFSDEEFAGVMNELAMVDKYIRLKNREILLNHLTSHNITVDVFGTGWEHYNCANPECLNIHGQLSFTETLDAMCNSQIVLNALPLFLDGSHERVFTSMLCGAVCVSESNTYLKEEFEDGTNICFFDMNNLDELVATLQNLLSDSENATTIALAGQQLAFEKHTWAARAKQILEIAENVLSEKGEN